MRMSHITTDDVRTIDTLLFAQAAENNGLITQKLFPYKKDFIKVIHPETKEENYIICQMISSKMTVEAYYICKYKAVTKKFLNDASLSTAKGMLFKKEDIDAILPFFEEMKKPVVIKPSFGIMGKGVFMDIETEDEVLSALEHLSENKSDEIILEEQVAGTEYRITATRNKLLAVTNRQPAHVVGDGTHTILELIHKKNNNPERKQNRALKDVPYDTLAKETLHKNNLSLSSIPEKDAMVLLRNNSNISAGGDSVDYTDKIHPYIKELAPKIIRAIPGLPYAGIDFLTTDISKDPREIGYCVIELNASPMISIHHLPCVGKSRNVADEIIKEILL
jgi:cyanophycin synthetase